mmetsp:Transcript_44518/g.135698  ORF Transcript_44518/g.135698 Transcript_44518/m.135698 type:complete len:464 (-) Transcript_44518:1601-2992(-)
MSCALRRFSAISPSLFLALLTSLLVTSAWPSSNADSLSVRCSSILVRCSTHGPSSLGGAPGPVSRPRRKSRAGSRELYQGTEWRTSETRSASSDQYSAGRSSSSSRSSLSPTSSLFLFTASPPAALCAREPEAKPPPSARAASCARSTRCTWSLLVNRPSGLPTSGAGSFRRSRSCRLCVLCSSSSIASFTSMVASASFSLGPLLCVSLPSSESVSNSESVSDDSLLDTSELTDSPPPGAACTVAGRGPLSDFRSRPALRDGSTRGCAPSLKETSRAEGRRSVSATSFSVASALAVGTSSTALSFSSSSSPGSISSSSGSRPGSCSSAVTSELPPTGVASTDPPHKAGSSCLSPLPYCSNSVAGGSLTSESPFSTVSACDGGRIPEFFSASGASFVAAAPTSPSWGAETKAPKLSSSPSLEPLASAKSSSRGAPLPPPPSLPEASAPPAEMHFPNSLPPPSLV